MPKKGFMGLEGGFLKKGQSSGSDKPKGSARDQHFIGQGRNPESTVNTSDQQAGSSSGESTRPPERLNQEQLDKLAYERDKGRQECRIDKQREFGANLSENHRIQHSIDNFKKAVKQLHTDKEINQQAANEYNQLLIDIENRRLQRQALTPDQRKQFSKLTELFQKAYSTAVGMEAAETINLTYNDMVERGESEGEIVTRMQQLSLEGRRRQNAFDKRKL